MDFKFGKKYIGDARKAFLIAEVAQAHDGSLGYAHSFIDAASEAGVDAVKFQAHFAQYESTLDELLGLISHTRITLVTTTGNEWNLRRNNG